MRILTFPIFALTLVTAGASNADLIAQFPIWERNITHVYVCSLAETISPATLEEYYANKPEANISAEFHDGWSYSNDEKITAGVVVIVSIAPQESNRMVEDCLQRFPFFQESWFEDIRSQSREIGTVPEYLANTPLGDYYKPLKASWIYRYSDATILSSYTYQSPEYLVNEEVLAGALQFKASTEFDTVGNGEN